MYCQVPLSRVSDVYAFWTGLSITIKFGHAPLLSFFWAQGTTRGLWGSARASKIILWMAHVQLSFGYRLRDVCLFHCNARWHGDAIWGMKFQMSIPVLLSCELHDAIGNNTLKVLDHPAVWKCTSVSGGSTCSHPDVVCNLALCRMVQVDGP